MAEQGEELYRFNDPLDGRAFDVVADGDGGAFARVFGPDRWTTRYVAALPSEEVQALQLALAAYLHAEARRGR